mgnify:FL=1|jgi:hypothetical protein
MGLISNGTTIFDAGALDSGLAKGAMTFIKKLTASSSGTLSFVNGASGVVLDGTYKEYLFTFNNIHPSAESRFSFQGSINGGSGYGVTATTTFFQAYHREDTGDSTLTYNANEDIEQATGIIHFGEQTDPSSGDHSNSGYLQLFNPSSTTFVKSFIATNSHNYVVNYLNSPSISGYFNTTSAVNAIQFKFESGNIDAGDICLYGIS